MFCSKYTHEVYLLWIRCSFKKCISYCFALAIVFTSVILSCDVHVCLTWEAQRENITFKCKVSHLQWRVYFYNPLNKEEGHCLSPIPISTCYSSHNVISQDRKTNTTFLVIHREVDNKLDGPWKCIHGTRREEAIVNVTVIHKGNFTSVTKTLYMQTLRVLLRGFCLHVILAESTLIVILNHNKNKCSTLRLSICKYFISYIEDFIFYIFNRTIQ